MDINNDKQMRVAILDLYEGMANEGIRCIRGIVEEFAKANGLAVVIDEFDVRLKKELPGPEYDIYISSGGPGSPLEDEGGDWEDIYFNWLQQVEDYNKDAANPFKKYVFLICHSFQLACRHYNIGTVCKRRSTSFGVFPVHFSEEGMNEPVFKGIKDPFYAVDNRDYQVIDPNYEALDETKAVILALEKERPHIPLERAIMAVRFNAYMIGFQCHPEADANGMSTYLQTEGRKKTIVDNFGEEKWQSMVAQLSDPEKVLLTYARILPNFLRLAIADWQKQTKR
jgi:homoserine O-succinyltransferase